MLNMNDIQLDLYIKKRIKKKRRKKRRKKKRKKRRKMRLMKIYDDETYDSDEVCQMKMILLSLLKQLKRVIQFL